MCPCWWCATEARIPRANGPLGGRFSWKNRKEEGASAPAAAEAEEITPRTNPDFLGHADVEQALLRDCIGGRLPHALVLAGPAGIGKATLAFRLARFLFAQAPQDAGLFGEAPAPANLFVSPSNPVFRRVASSAPNEKTSLSWKVTP